MVKGTVNKKKRWKRDELLAELENVFTELIHIAKREIQISLYGRRSS